MSSLLASVRHNLRGLARFGGRDDRRTFWPYAASIIILLHVALVAVMLPELTASMARMQRFAVENPELATVRYGPGSYSISVRGHHPELLPDMGRMVSSMALVLAVAAALLAAAIARRLRDAGWWALWGLVPIPFLLFAMIVMPKLFRDPNLEMRLFFAMFLNNTLYMASLVFLVFLLIKPSKTPAHNL